MSKFSIFTEQRPDKFDRYVFLDMLPKTILFKQLIPISIENAWDFFSSPGNLAKITPTKMGFRIKTAFVDGQKIYPGILISYTLTPVLGIRMNWTTEITHVKDGEYFIDEQRFGPYSFWHHQHHFKAIERGIEMIDILTYAVPMGLIGTIANKFFVESQVLKIFEYRTQKIEELFGKFPV